MYFLAFVYVCFTIEPMLHFWANILNLGFNYILDFLAFIFFLLFSFCFVFLFFPKNTTNWVCLYNTDFFRAWWTLYMKFPSNQQFKCSYTVGLTFISFISVHAKLVWIYTSNFPKHKNEPSFWTSLMDCCILPFFSITQPIGSVEGLFSN